ncbi:MAG: hypothetical protein ABJF50_16545 [Paracoccaceae bacterium]
MTLPLWAQSRHLTLSVGPLADRKVAKVCFADKPAIGELVTPNTVHNRPAQSGHRPTASARQYGH